MADIDNEKYVGRTGFGIIQLFKCLLLQFIEDISDRELERYLQENTAAKGLKHICPKQGAVYGDKGIAKNQFTEFMYAIAFNLKRLTVLNANI